MISTEGDRQHNEPRMTSRLHRAVITNKPVDEDLLEYGHTLHCTRMIMQWMDPNIPRTTISSATSGTPFCRSSRLGLMGKRIK
ncbi:hypothetical protein LY78DRAFT_479048 [Colletotrichum sublineola]|nr:hypothetical protein LY78DRAFT_479048 [Colletotrichum sublineola]